MEIRKRPGNSDWHWRRREEDENDRVWFYFVCVRRMRQIVCSALRVTNRSPRKFRCCRCQAWDHWSASRPQFQTHVTDSPFRAQARAEPSPRIYGQRRRTTSSKTSERCSNFWGCPSRSRRPTSTPPSSIQTMGSRHCASPIRRWTSRKWGAVTSSFELTLVQLPAAAPHGWRSGTFLPHPSSPLPKVAPTSLRTEAPSRPPTWSDQLTKRFDSCTFGRGCWSPIARSSGSVRATLTWRSSPSSSPWTPSRVGMRCPSPSQRQSSTLSNCQVRRNQIRSCRLPSRTWSGSADGLCPSLKEIWWFSTGSTPSTSPLTTHSNKN